MVRVTYRGGKWTRVPAVVDRDRGMTRRATRFSHASAPAPRRLVPPLLQQSVALVNFLDHLRRIPRLQMAPKQKSTRRSTRKSNEETLKSKHFVAEKKGNKRPLPKSGRKTKVKADELSNATSELSEDEDDEASSAYEDESAKSEDDLDSDALDDVDYDVATRKRKSGGNATKRSTPKKSPRKKRKAMDDDYEDDDLEEGQEIVGRIVEAPKTGRGARWWCLFCLEFLKFDICLPVPPGQISQNTLNFLKKLSNPEYNDRDWYASLAQVRTNP